MNTLDHAINPAVPSAPAVVYIGPPADWLAWVAAMVEELHDQPVHWREVEQTAAIPGMCDQLHSKGVEPAVLLLAGREAEDEPLVSVVLAPQRLHALADPLLGGEWYRAVNPAEPRELAHAIRDALRETRLARELSAREHAIQQLMEMRDTFLANTSHELRTPLNGIIGMAWALLDQRGDNLTVEQRDWLNIIAQSGERLRHLVNDMLDMSRLKRGHIEPRLAPVRIQETTRMVVSLLRPLAAQKALTIEERIPAELPPAMADDNRLQQILHNLIGNAIKFTSAGKVSVSAEVVTREFNPEISMISPDLLTPVEHWADAKESALVAITVQDTGIGIAQENLERIFDPFRQEQTSLTREYGGIGLGLSISRQLVELQRGGIYVASHPGEGSRFVITLPIAHANTPGQPGETREPEPVSAFTREPPRAESATPARLAEGARHKILVVEDDPPSRRLLQRYLEQAGYPVFTAASGPQALETIAAGLVPDLVLLDVMMPDMNGYEVTLKLRERWPATELPILLVTAVNEVSDLVRGLEVGANDYLSKPVHRKELLARMQTHLAIKHLVMENRLAGQAFDSSHESIFITNEDSRIIKINRAFTDMFGFTAEEALGRNPSLIGSNRHPREFYERMWDGIHAVGYWSGEIINRRKNGEIVTGWLRINAMRNARGETTNYIGVFSDNSAQRQNQERLYQLSHYDGMTGLPNQDTFLERLTDEARMARQEKTWIAVVLIGLPEYEQLTANLGANRRNFLIRNVSTRLIHQLPVEQYAFARLRNDRFGLFISGLNHPASAETSVQQVLDQLFANLEEPFPLAESMDIHLDVAVGVAIHQDEADLAPDALATTLLDRARIAQAEAPHPEFGDAVWFSTEMLAYIKLRDNLKEDLRVAMDREELELVYQPIVATEGNTIAAVEALVRWNHPDLGILEPTEFLVLAEESDVLAAIGQWVLRAACAQNQAWQAAGYRPIRMMVNLCHGQIFDAALADRVATILRDTGLPPQWLILEFSEDLAVQWLNKTKNQIQALRRLDVRMSLDDFGTGSAPLTLLHNLPLHSIKLHGDISARVVEPEGATFIAAIVNMAHGLNLKVVAEGVATEETAGLLHWQGCDYLQGFHLHPPMKAEQVAGLLRQHSV